MKTSFNDKPACRPFFPVISGFFLYFSSVACLAAYTSPTNCAIAQYDFLSTYHEFSNTPNDKHLKRNLVASNMALSECIRMISASLTPDIVNQLSNAQKGMQTELNFNINSLEKTGTTPGQPVANMVNYALETTKILELQIDSKSTTSSSLRKQAIMMAYIKSRYLERAYSLGGDLFRETSAERSIEDLVVDFSKKLDVLRKDKALASNAALYKNINTAYVRFNFLKKSIIDYNTSAVPFVVEYHSTFIIKTLLDIADELDKQSAKAA